MNDIGKGIAIAGIWIGAGVAALGGHTEVSEPALYATFFIWLLF